MKRRPPPFAFILAIAAFLFAQLMGAVHACDAGMMTKAPSKAAIVADDGMDCCDHGQPAPDPACDNHCQQANKAPERAQVASPAPLVATGFAMPASPATAMPKLSSPHQPVPGLGRLTEPSIPIRNCCFRI